jgi:hypothetical protein
MSETDRFTWRTSRAPRRKEKNSDAQLTGQRSAGFNRMEPGCSRKPSTEERSLRPGRDTIRPNRAFNQSLVHNPASQLSKFEGA